MSLFTMLNIASARTDLAVLNPADIESLKDYRYEDTAYAQFSLGSSSASLKSVTNAKMLTLVSNASNVNTPQYQPAYMSFNSGRGTYLATDLIDNNANTGFTLSAVVRVPTATLTTTALYGLFGLWTGASAGAIAYYRNGKFNLAATVGQVHTETANQVFDKWMHVTLSVDNVNKTVRLQLVIDGVMTTYSYNLTSRTYADAALGLGNMFVAGTAYFNTDTAEFVVFNSALSSAQISQLYGRAKKRMSDKAITI